MITVVNQLNLVVNQGEIFAFLGPSGAGKTTTIKLLTTLLPITDGQALVAGFDVRRQPQAVRQHIGYVSQNGGSDTALTGRANMQLIGKFYEMPRQSLQQQIEKLSEVLGLQEILDRPAKTYSGGQLRRLDIALGMIHQPAVLFMDEPTTGLDPQNRLDLAHYLKQLAGNGLTIFITTHLMDEAEALADRISIMDHGQIVALGTSSELKSQLGREVITISLEAHPDAPSRLQSVLADLPYVTKTTNNAELDFQLQVEDSAAHLPELFQQLAAANLRIAKFNLSQPTLNDVFIAKTGRSMPTTETE